MVLPITVTTEDDNLELYKSLGVTECNWQLFQSDISNIDATIEKMKSSGLNIVSLHSPFDKNSIAPLLEYFADDKSQAECIYFAEKICQKLGKRLPLVFHSALPYYAMSVIPRQAEALDGVLLNCPDVDVLIENVGMGYPLSYYVLDIPKMIPLTVREFNKFLIRPIYACLDICHAEVVARITQKFNDLGIIAVSQVPTVEQFFREFEPVCKLVHFANTREFGNTRGKHGVGFTDSDKNDLINYLSLCKTYVPQAKIVLELSEMDYSHRANLLSTLKTLSSIDESSFTVLGG